MHEQHHHHRSPVAVEMEADHSRHGMSARGAVGHAAAPDRHAVHTGHEGHADRFRRLFWIMLALAVPVVAFSEMTAVEPVDGDARRLLTIAAAAESDSEHPLARAIVAAARAEGLVVPPARDFESSPAEGVRARVDGRLVEVGGPYLLQRAGATELAVARDWRDEGAIIVHVLVDSTVVGALRLADAVRPESKRAVEALQGRGIHVVMITGDADAVAQSVAADLGIERVFSGVRPEDKASKVAQLQHEGRTVAMVGDGVNDAPALAQADVGIAIGAGTDVAIASAEVILASSDPRALLSVIELSHATYRKMAQNLWWAAGYNLLSVPLAAGILAPFGFVLPMSVGAILMSLSTIVVALNAQLLRRLDLRPDAVADRRPHPSNHATSRRDA